jgi:tyrosinase
LYAAHIVLDNLDRDTVRNIDKTRSNLPTASDLRHVIERSNWYGFSSGLEELSKKVHGFVGGDMGTIAFSSYDPLFYVHACAVDRTWAKWQQAFGNKDIDGDFLDTVLAPFNFRVRDILFLTDLGYSYD